MKATVCLPAIGVFLCASLAQATVIHVDTSGGGDYLTIQEGMNAATSGDTVLVAPGTYSLTSRITYDGKQVLLASQLGPDCTVIDCQGACQAIFWNGEGPGAALVGFTIRNGHSDEGGAVYCGGGAAPTVSNCVVRDCSAQRGGAFYVHQSAITILDSEITGCSATVWGGAIYCYNSSGAWFEGLVVGGNTGDGAGIYVWHGTPLVYLCTFYRNGANLAGGATIHCRDSDPMIIQSIVAFSILGKGVYCEDFATPYIANCDFFGNAGGDGTCGTPEDNGAEDPRFCEIDAGDVTLCANSWCLPSGNPWNAPIGALGQGCGACDAEIAPASWGAVKSLYR